MTTIRQSKQMKQIIEVLELTDYKLAEEAKFHYGLFSITHIASELNPDVHYENIPRSRIGSIYRTLATMVKRGLVVKQAHKQSGSCERLPTLSYSYHLTDKLQDDIELLAKIESNRPSMNECLDRFGAL